MGGEGKGEALDLGLLLTFCLPCVGSYCVGSNAGLLQGMCIRFHVEPWFVMWTRLREATGKGAGQRHKLA